MKPYKNLNLVTLRASCPECVGLETSTPVTWDGTVQKHIVGGVL